MPSKVWDDITHLSPKSNGCTVEVWEWESNFIQHVTMNAITHPCWDLSWSMLVKGATGMFMSLLVFVQMFTLLDIYIKDLSLYTSSLCTFSATKNLSSWVFQALHPVVHITIIILKQHFICSMYFVLPCSFEVFMPRSKFALNDIIFSLPPSKNHAKQFLLSI